MNGYTVINVTGNGYCGSSAVTDYLRGFDCIASVNQDLEFTLLYDIDGVDDLRHHITQRSIRFFSSDASVKRFRRYIHRICSIHSNWRKIFGDRLIERSEQFLSEIVTLEWRGWWHYDVVNATGLRKLYNFSFLPRLNRILSRIGLPTARILKKSRMHLADISDEHFMRSAGAFIGDVVSQMNPQGSRYVLLDQATPANYVDRYLDYFQAPVKSILVYRDPRDVYMLVKTLYKSGDSWIPFHDVEAFIEYYRQIYRNFPRESTDNALVVRFEDLVYHYEETADRIDSFLSLKKDEMREQRFRWEVSIENTQLFKRNSAYAEDIQRIEEALPEWLFDFSSSPLQPKGKQFF